MPDSLQLLSSRFSLRLSRLFRKDAAASYFPRFLLAILVIVFSGCAGLTPSTKLAQSDQDSRTAATNWLALLDRRAYKEAYEEEVSRVKIDSKESDFVGKMNARRATLGNAKAREFVQVHHSSTMNSAPDGNYMIIWFKTKFERKAVCYERVILTKETGRWQVSGYRIE